MTFDEILAQVLELLQREGRLSYLALKLRFNLDDAYLDALKAELIDAKRLAADEDGKVLVWTGASPVSGSTFQVSSSTPPPASSTQLPDAPRSTLHAPRADGERRQLTVQFCDLVDSTKLSEQLDPEEYRVVVRSYQETCAQVIRRYAGHTAQHLGDGILVYFGYPVAHEDDAQRAVRTGLEILTGLQSLNAQLHPAIKAGLPHPIQVRIGIHTGLVVVGEIGSSEKREILALGETPNIAARLQGLAEPDTVVISGAIYRLVQGLFECQDRGTQELKGISIPLSVYRVIRESEAQSRFEVAIRTGLTPLVGREPELGLLKAHWEQAKTGAGQVVLVSGEPGIGKSRLVQELKEHVIAEGATRIEFRCSPYHQNSALYPIIDHLQRLLQFARDDAPAAKLEKLQHTLSHYRFPQADTLPLLAALLSLPHPDGYPPITLSPQKQKEKTQAALVAWLVEETERAPVYNPWEDVHWADPSTLDVLHLVIDQAPTARLYVLLTFRPEFLPPWGNRSHLNQITLSRLERLQVEVMVEHIVARTLRPSTSSGRTDSGLSGETPPVRAEPVEARTTLPPEVVQQVVSKTDGVPLFVEELTKAVMESVGAHTGSAPQSPDTAAGGAPLPLTIPATLHDSLMARLDRLGRVKKVAQLGATLGREFSYELLAAVSPLDEETLQRGLKQLVEVELVYQRGLPPQAHYLFKHALIQDTAYQSLLKSTRQQYHCQIAQVLEARFRETVEAQPELVARHYTEAGLIEQSLPYWQRAGERANQRSAYMEAISHLTRGLELLKTLPDTPERVQQELTLQLALGGPLMVTKGYTASEVEKTYTRMRELCQQLEETPQLFPVLYMLVVFYFNRGELQTSHELAEQLLRLAQSVQDRDLLSRAHTALGWTLYWLGELTSARTHVEQAIALYDPQQHPGYTVVTDDPRLQCLSYAAWILWGLGYPEQGLKRSHEALTLARGLSRPFSLALPLGCAALFHLLRREGQLARERAEEVMTLSTEQGFPYWLACGSIVRGSALAEGGQVKEGVAQIQQGLAAYRAMGTELGRPRWLALLAAAYGKVGQTEEGLKVLAEALAHVEKNGERYYEAELYRLKGTLTLQSKVQGPKSKVEESSESGVRSPESKEDSLVSSVQSLEAEAEECFQKAIAVAQRQQAKSLELRATVSLARLWQQQDKKDEARQMLAEIYGWFTEGFDTKDLQEAKALLDSLGSGV
jgi:class 3 adenylate cyclase/predicted ATPase